VVVGFADGNFSPPPLFTAPGVLELIGASAARVVWSPPPIRPSSGTLTAIAATTAAVTAVVAHARAPGNRVILGVSGRLAKVSAKRFAGAEESSGRSDRTAAPVDAEQRAAPRTGPAGRGQNRESLLGSPESNPEGVVYILFSAVIGLSADVHRTFVATRCHLQLT
jgi:hypothetical protein